MMYVMMGAAVVVIRLVGRAGRRSLAKTLVNRRTQAIVIIALSMALTLEVACHALGVSFEAMVVLHFVVRFHAACIIAAVVDRRLWGSLARVRLGPPRTRSCRAGNELARRGHRHLKV